MRQFAIAGGLALILFAGAVPAFAQTAEEGRQVYEANCQACHQVGGAGVPGSFPPLAGNPAVEDADYVSDVIRNGLSGELAVLGETYDSQMPALPQLSDGQIDAVIAYILTLSEPPPVTTTSEPQPGPITGDAKTGEALFGGSRRLGEGGPACISCHTSRAGLGPDLAGVFGRLGGEAGLRGWLAAPPSPTMQPIFSDRPMTETEIADLTAHLEILETDAQSGGFDWFPLVGLGGLLVLLGFMAVMIRGPRTTYVERLRSEA